MPGASAGISGAVRPRNPRLSRAMVVHLLWNALAAVLFTLVILYFILDTTAVLYASAIVLLVLVGLCRFLDNTREYDEL